MKKLLCEKFFITEFVKEIENIINMKFLKFALFLSIVFLLQQSITAQEWVSYQSQQQVNDLIEDGNKLLLATDAGLVVMNKTTLEKEIFNKANTSLTNNHIASMAQSANGDNWIGIYDVVIGRFDGTDIQDA
ncbi:MAG: acetyltransferase-like isoleucine patch superfamily enzyme [Saprospiraceae bacterium]|jgi:acetyltransferase-like isoleucine patch superfamily enzyme